MIKNQKGIGIYLFFFIAIFFMQSLVCVPVCAKNGTLTIALDPGHGGDEDGARYYGLLEKDINYQMAELVKKELECYSNVRVVLTRVREEQLSLSERAIRAEAAGADILLSLHFNASASHSSNGASIYISTGEKYRKDLKQFADYLLGEFEAIGLDNAGTFARVTQMGGRREDGTFDDYYGILRHAYNNGMPAMIIEHCYMDAQKDKPYFDTQEGLQQLARADANGIAAYYNLVKKNGEKVIPKSAEKFGASTKAIEKNYFEAPRITKYRLIDYSGIAPDVATFEIGVEDEAGLTSIYFVYKNASTGETATIYPVRIGSLITGTSQIKLYISENLEPGTYMLSYIGVYNQAGYDAGYNIAGTSMVGFGKCEWLNSFDYTGEADFIVEEKVNISDAHAEKIMKKLRGGMQRKLDIEPLFKHQVLRMLE